MKQLEAILHILLSQPGDVAVFALQAAACLGTCLFCWSRGGRSDRIAALLFGGVWVGWTLTLWSSLIVTGQIRQPMPFLVLWDVGPALAFLWLAVRYNNLYFGAFTIAQGLQFAISAFDLTLHEPAGTPLPVVLALIADALNLAMMGALIGSAAGARRRRVAQAA